MHTVQTINQAIRDKAKELTALSEKVHTAAEKDPAGPRVLSEDEEKQLEAGLQELRDLEAKKARAEGQTDVRRQIEALMSKSERGETLPSMGREPAGAVGIKSAGQQFVESDAFKQILATHGTRGIFNTVGVEVQSPLHATTISTDSGSAGQLLTPQYLPGGPLPLLFWPLTIADLMAQGTADSTSIKYMVESTFTNAAGMVSPGGTKPESALAFTLRTDEVQKVAHWIPVQDEMLDDVPYMRSTVDARLVDGLKLKEEDQLLNGDGVAPNILGLLNRTGITTDQARAADTNVDAIHKAMTRTMIASLLQPDGVVIHPTNWETIALAKNAAGDYYAGGPFAATAQQTLWGVRVVKTTRITANSALTGAFRAAAQLFRKGGIVLSASNSHSDFFVKNLTAVRAEERLALAVYRPAAFVEITGLN